MSTPLSPGGAYYGAFPTPVMPNLVEIGDVFTVSAVAIHNGLADPSFVLTVTQPSPGCWSVHGVVPDSWQPGDTFAIFATLTDTTHAAVIPILVDVVLVGDPKLAGLVAIAEAKAEARKAVLQAMENIS